MRITNKIMRNNSLYNINNNKLVQDKLANQMTNQSKIVRPSDDPVVAVRALRLRSNVTNVSQYYDKNAPDAEQWLTVTSDALSSVDEVLTDLYKQATDASNKKWKSEDLDIFLTQMESLTEAFYDSANLDYAGRFVFSGYRTDTPITFTAEDEAEMTKHPVTYTITEEFDYSKIDKINYTDFSDLTNEQQVTNNDIFRIRLSYDDLTDNLPNMGDGYGNAFLDVAGNPMTITKYEDAETAYRDAANGTLTGVAYIPSTGEMVFSENYYKNNLSNGMKFQITYDKAEWKNGDINPVHYFKCTADCPTKGTNISYNNTPEELNNQEIFYDVGFNQKIQVNSMAKDVFSIAVSRDIDDFKICLTQLKGIEKQLTDIEKDMSETAEDTAAYEALKLKQEAAQKAEVYIRENLHTKFENQITKYQEYMNDTNVEITNNATRGSRLELISNRLMNQKATFKDLQTGNEGIDTTEVAVELKSSELTYQAALMATGKIMQTNLMNFI